MFEVMNINNDGSKETWDALTAIQAECIFFRLQKIADVTYVELNEVTEWQTTYH